MSDKVRYNAICNHCGTARFVWLTTLIGAAPVFCICGSIMTLSGTAAPVSSPHASNVRSVEVPASERCILGTMKMPDGKTHARQSVFIDLMVEAFGDEDGLTGYKLV